VVRRDIRDTPSRRSASGVSALYRSACPFRVDVEDRLGQDSDVVLEESPPAEPPRYH